MDGEKGRKKEKRPASFDSPEKKTECTRTGSNGIIHVALSVTKKTSQNTVCTTRQNALFAVCFSRKIMTFITKSSVSGNQRRAPTETLNGQLDPVGIAKSGTIGITGLAKGGQAISIKQLVFFSSSSSSLCSFSVCKCMAATIVCKVLVYSSISYTVSAPQHL